MISIYHLAVRPTFPHELGTRRSAVLHGRQHSARQRGHELGQRNRQKGLHDALIELCAAAAPDLDEGDLGRQRLAVGTVGGHGVEGVGDREDARAKRDVAAARPAWIARAIIGFMMYVLTGV